jgi:hypothetical protein
MRQHLYNLVKHMPMNRPKWPESGRGSPDHLLALQRLATSNLVISVTRRCPLRCAHCIVSSAPDVAGGTLTVEQAQSWARQLPKLKEAGVRHLTFTGGEPTLALKAIRVLAESCSSLGITTAVVTSGVWATAPAVATHIVEQLRAVSNWDLGYDTYHAPEMPFERFQQAVEALKSSATSFSVRVCVDTPLSATDAEICGRLRDLAGPDVTILQQSVRHIGRATSLSRQASDEWQFPAEPCITSGPFIREDGSMGPCCSGLAHEARGRHPLEFGNVNDDGLVACRERWLSDPLLRMLRLFGFAVPLQWIKEAGLKLPSVELPNNVCELCVSLWDSEGTLGHFLRERASGREVAAQLDRFEDYLFR